jgi:DNA-binding CsgD family transcriptional regulator
MRDLEFAQAIWLITGDSQQRNGDLQARGKLVEGATERKSGADAMSDEAPDGAPALLADRVGGGSLADRPLRDLVREVDPAPHGMEREVVFQGEIDGAHYTLTRQPRPAPDPQAPALSSREREIGRMIAKGYTNKTIAVVLEISSWTVDTHVRRIFAKLGVRSRGAMVARLAAAGLVGAGDDRTPDWRTAWARRSGER